MGFGGFIDDLSSTTGTTTTRRPFGTLAAHPGPLPLGTCKSETAAPPRGIIITSLSIHSFFFFRFFSPLLTETLLLLHVTTSTVALPIKSAQLVAVAALQRAVAVPPSESGDGGGDTGTGSPRADGLGCAEREQHKATVSAVRRGGRRRNQTQACFGLQSRSAQLWHFVSAID